MPCSSSRYRLTHVQRFVLDVIRAHPQISYDGMAEQAEIDRQTAIQAIRRLTRLYQVVKVDGRGRQPNRYLLTDRVLVCRPGYVPSRIEFSPNAEWFRRQQERMSGAKGYQRDS